MRRSSLAILCFFLLSGCIFDPRFDTSNWPAFQKSAVAIRAKLNNDDLRRISVALNYLVAEGMPNLNAQFFNTVAMQPTIANSDVALARLGARINGLSAQAVVENLRMKLDAEIAEIDARLKSSQPAMQSLEISSASYYWKSSGRMAMPVVEFSVYNGGSVPVSNAAFNLVLTTRNRTIPWATQGVLENFAGGLEPRERRQITYQPYGEWASAELKDLPETDLKVTLVNFVNAKGERVIAFDPRSLDIRRRVRDALN